MIEKGTMMSKFKRSSLPKEMEEFISGAEKINDPEEVSGLKTPTPVIREEKNQGNPPTTFATPKFRVRSLESFNEFDGEGRAHQVAIFLSERDREMLDYCLRVGEHRSKHAFVVDALRSAMTALIRAQEE